MRVLIVDDDRTLSDLVAFTLRREGYETLQAFDGEAALTRWRVDRPDLIILDLNLPKKDGFAVCRAIRREDDIPIIMLTVRGEEDDMVTGLGLGADDYMLKPFSPRQLVARIQALLRRAGKTQPATLRQARDLVLDTSRRQVRIAEGPLISLTSLENRLLDYLMANAGHVLPNEAIINHVWGPEGGDRDMLRQLMRRLRGKIEPNPAEPLYIETIPGLGYGFVGTDLS
ncbi:MAG: response regulator transcription factor [Candidatus Promineifilaceae bacterium]|nr:response regulator transcription factor [Candidatus Promineifilaceae bacterium]